MEKNFVELSKFFSKSNEENGKWFEPTVRGVGIGAEFKVYGPNSSAAAIAKDKYEKALDQIEKIEDPKIKSDNTDIALADYAADLCADIRSADGKELLVNGKTVTKQDIRTILYESPTIATSIARFQSKQDNFLSD